MNRVQLSTEYFPNPVASKALSNANIYVGNPDTDPEVVANRKPVSALQEDGTIVSVAQPVKTGLGGIPVYNGSPITMLVDGQYSIKVTSSSGAQLYYVPVNYKTDESPVTTVSDITSLRATLSQTGDGEVVYLTGHTSINDGGQGPFYWDADSVLADDNGTVVQVTGVAVGRWIRQSSGYFNSAMFGMDRTGATDATQKFINLLAVTSLGVRNIELLDGTYKVNPRLLLAKVKDNTRLVFSKDAWLVASYGGSDISEVLGVIEVDNVTIINPQIIGDADVNPLLTEGAGHCISVRGSSNVKIIGGDVSKAFTDGLYLNNNSNVEVYGGDYHGNGRQGISLVSGDNIYIHDVKCRDSYRVAPKGGIDIEPNYADYRLKNIRISNLETSGNLGGGLIMTLHGIDNDVDVIIDGHTDKGSTCGTRFSCYPMVTHTPTFLPGSRVIYRSGRSIDSTIAGMQIIWEADGSPELTIDSPLVHNPNRSGGTNERQQNVGISIHNEISGYIGTKIGNINIIRPKVTMDGANTIQRGIYAGYNLGVSKLRIVDPIEISIGDNSNLSNSLGHELITATTVPGDVVTITDAFDALTLISGNNVIRNYSSSFYTNIISTYTSGGVTIDRALNFGKTASLVVAKSNSTNLMTVLLPPGITFINSAGSVVSTSATSSTENAVLKFEKVSATMYRVLAITGTWTIT